MLPLASRCMIQLVAIQPIHSYSISPTHPLPPYPPNTLSCCQQLRQQSSKQDSELIAQSRRGEEEGEVGRAESPLCMRRGLSSCGGLVTWCIPSYLSCKSHRIAVSMHASSVSLRLMQANVSDPQTEKIFHCRFYHFSKASALR